MSKNLTQWVQGALLPAAYFAYFGPLRCNLVPESTLKKWKMNQMQWQSRITDAAALVAMQMYE